MSHETRFSFHLLYSESVTCNKSQCRNTQTSFPLLFNVSLRYVFQFMESFADNTWKNYYKDTGMKAALKPCFRQNH